MTGRKQIFYHTVKRSHHNTVFRQDDHAFAQHLGGDCLLYTSRYNMDINRVEARFEDGTTLAIDCITIEDE